MFMCVHGSFLIYWQRRRHRGGSRPPYYLQKRGKRKEKEKEKREEREKGKGEKERRGKKKKRSKFPSLAMVRRRGKLPLAPSDTLPPCGMLTDAVLKLLVFVFSAHFPMKVTWPLMPFLPTTLEKSWLRHCPGAATHASLCHASNLIIINKFTFSLMSVTHNFYGFYHIVS